MSGMSGQARITVTKPDGRQFEQVIDNDIEDAVYTKLRAQIMSFDEDEPMHTGAPYFSTPRVDSDLVPARMKIHLSTGGSWLADAGEISEAGLADAGDHLYIEYSTKTPLPIGNNFDGTINGYVNQVELMANDGTTRIANATTSNTTFTSTSHTDIGHLIDGNDTVSCTYRIQIQSFADTSDAYALLLLGVIRGEINDITMARYRLTDSLGGQIKDTSSASLAASGASPNFIIGGSTTYVTVNQVPVGFEILTHSNVSIMEKALSTGSGNSARLGAMIPGDTVTVPFEFTLNKLTSVAADPSP